MSATTAELDVEGNAPIALYRLYSADGSLLWVGITQNLGDRFAQHAQSKLWWPEVARKTVAWCADRTDAERAEAAAVRNEQPLYNVRLQPLPEMPRERERPLTSAERQRRHRERQVQRIAELEQANAALYSELGEARRQLATARSALADANEEIGKLAGQQCRHPAAAVDGGRCAACGADVW